MAELLITGVWVFTLAAVLYFGVAEIARLVSIEEVSSARRRGVLTPPGAMYFDVTRVEREIMGSARYPRARRR